MLEAELLDAQLGLDPVNEKDRENDEEGIKQYKGKRDWAVVWRVYGRS